MYDVNDIILYICIYIHIYNRRNSTVGDPNGALKAKLLLRFSA